MYRKISYFLFAVFSLVSVAGAFAQTVPVLGEIKSFGKVFIGSSTGQWSSALPTYPLLENTALRTEDGSASIAFKDGSRVDLSRDTIATISGSSADYMVTLAQGVIAFNMGPSSSLSVATPTAHVSVNSKNDLVQKVGYEKSNRVLGVISATEKGTEVKTISGKILVSSSASGTRTLASGESIFVSPDNNYKVYKTQGVGGTTPEEEDSRRRRRAGALLFAGTAAGEGLVLYGINYIFTHNDHNGPKSPSTP